MRNKLTILKDIILNIFDRSSKLVYIIEPEDWAVKWVGKYLAENLNSKRFRMRLSSSAIGIQNKIIHFGSLNTLVSNQRIKNFHKSNKVVLTIFHIDPRDKRIKLLKQLNEKIDIVNTSSSITKKSLIEAGIKKSKIKVIPLGIDLKLFHPVSQKQKLEIRKKLKLPENAFIIGSFQKDGEGWDKGLKPKLVKGPDIFIKVLEKNKKNNPYVLLSGPARGYVKKGLDKLKIPYKHTYLKNYKKITSLYQALDLYLITSRHEGGPMSFLEAWASKIPVVSTRVGIVGNIGKNGKNVLISETENINSLAKNVKLVMTDKKMRIKIAQNGLKESKKYTWCKIAKRYYQEIYRGLLMY